MTNYFKETELKCKCGCNQLKFDAEFKNLLNRIRTLFNKPIYITSGYRCEKHNKEVGGKPTSSHLKGIAVDIKCDNSLDRYLLLRIFMDLGVRRIGVGKDFLHIDSDESKPYPVTWTY